MTHVEVRPTNVLYSRSKGVFFLYYHRHTDSVSRQPELDARGNEINSEAAMQQYLAFVSHESSTRNEPMPNLA